ncbi:MAG: alpha/beta hydrolase [Anaerolineae bacterium]|nr:alpha/beta hydrolase [Anaerolineae bacterium]
MTPVRLLHIAGHDLASIAFNADQPGVPVILIHGITGSVHFWETNLVAPFRDYGPCYSLSLPGHYPSVFPSHFTPDDLTAESIAHVLTLAIRELVGKRPVLLVGHSTGGFSVLAIAASTPEIAHGVISISGFAHGQWAGVLGMCQKWCRSGALGRLGFKLLLSTGKIHYDVFRRFISMYSPNPKRALAYPNIDAILKAAAYPAYRRLDLDAMTIYFRRMPDIDITPLLPRIAAPALVITGDADPIVPPAQAHHIAERVPGATLAVLESGVGHFTFYEVPETYRETVASWL